MPKGGCNSVETIAEAMRLQPGNCSYPANGTGRSCLPEATPKRRNNISTAVTQTVKKQPVKLNENSAI
jgi:hypothetical protein